ncbi:hypothetical protein GUJ93_ZPchr0007g4737 [Zizania palustris]|uniref:Myb/SANT-like domain-containing protein n=1 Tax=Zizania palustris TaxID=103762 RepID=A0A8J5TK64_ZIZPA|nr:hypothetical protein GUJ93_ZPchr0007g4737 [Zizania palustris]
MPRSEQMSSQPSRSQPSSPLAPADLPPPPSSPHRRPTSSMPRSEPRTSQLTSSPPIYVHGELLLAFSSLTLLNGWSKEAWNSMAHRVNDKFVSANFVVSQLKDREQRLKKDYNAVKTILSKSGFGWDNVLKMATTIDSLWSELPEKLQIWKNKAFPYYDDLHEIYNGKIAEGKHCRRSSEKSCKTENTFVGD